MKFVLFLLFSIVAVRAKKDEEEVCLMDPDPGPCRALFKRWAWNPVEERCERFDYGGCEGNDNNFETEEKCKYECWGKHVGEEEQKKNKEEMCLLDPEPGPCRAMLKRWAWNPVEEKCESFYYGGCFGNRNNFETEEKCKYECWDKHVN